MIGNGLRELTQNDWALIGTRTTKRIFKLGEKLISEGASIQHLYVIRKGAAFVELTGSHSKTRIATLVPGDVCGEIAFLVDSRATADVIAEDEQLESDAIRASDLRELIDLYPGFGARFYRSLAILLGHRLRQTSQELLRYMVSTSLTR